MIWESQKHQIRKIEVTFIVKMYSTQRKIQDFSKIESYHCKILKVQTYLRILNMATKINVLRIILII